MNPIVQRRRQITQIIALLIAIIVSLSTSVGQQPAEEQAAKNTFKLSTGGEIPLSDFIDYVSQRLNVRILYDESIRQKNVNLVAPDDIDVASLPQILQSVLINHGLVMTDTNQQGFKRITTNAQIPQVARPSDAAENLSDVDDAVPLTRVFVLTDNEPSKVADLIKPFLSSQGATVIPVDRTKLLVITDVARNIARAEQMIAILDGKRSQVEIEFVPAKNVPISSLAAQLREILTARRKAMGQESAEISGLEISEDTRTNSLILIGNRSDIQRAQELLAKLDQPLDTLERVFSLRYYSAERFDEIVRRVLEGRSPRPPYESRVEGNALIVNSTQEVLDLIARTKIEFDTREAPDSQSPIRFYKIKNVPASELLETINGISGGAATIPQRTPLSPRRRTTNDLAVPGPNLSPLQFPGVAQPVQVPLTPPAFRDTTAQAPLAVAESNDSATRDGFQAGFSDDLLDRDAPEDTDQIQLIRNAEVTVDIHTNTIIVVAPPEVQRIYAKLIETLDQRRPQVLIEAQVVIIDTSDDYSLGVEVSGGDRTGAQRLFSFSSYGLSTVDPTSGPLSIIPGVGFNGALIDPDTADVVVRALAEHRRARVVSVPRILVNDNAEGQLTSVIEVPFTSVNASQTVATTSFAGFAEAGTTITATPTISDDNYLQLVYAVTLNSFTGTGAAGVPPPRQTNEVRSRVTIPDGYTVIVGGLTSQNDSYEVDGLPLLERIPIIRDLTSLQTDGWQQTSLFVFLKPIILREDKFKDLRFISDTHRRRAEMPTNFPASRPLMIK